MLGFVGLGSLIKTGLIVSVVAGAFAYGQYTCQRAYQIDNLKLVVATERRLNAETTELVKHKADIERQVNNALEAADSDNSAGDVCISSNGLWRINNIE